MTRVLVTGAGGFLGSHIVEALVASPLHEVICVDSFAHNGEIDRLNLIFTNDDLRSRVRLVRHDLTVPFTPRQIHAIGHVYAVFDVASQSSVDVSISNPRDVILNNVGATVNTLELARDVNCQRYVHISTDEIYGPNDHPCSVVDHRPSSPYAASKAAQEDICLAYATTFHSPITIVTSANLFGERQSQLAFIPKIVKAGLNEGLLAVHTHNGVPGRRHYNYVRNVAEYLVRKLTEVATTNWPTRVALTGQHSVDNATLVAGVELIMQKTIRQRLVDGDQARPGYDAHYPHLDEPIEGFSDWACDEDQAEKNQRFYWQLEQTVNWFTEHPEWLE